LLSTAVIAGTVHDGEAPGFSIYPKKTDRTDSEISNHVQLPSNSNEISQLPLPQKVSRISNHVQLPSKDSMFSEGSQLLSGKTSKELSLDAEDSDIPWNDLVLKERIGAGTFLDRLGKKKT
jgi:serine/threonine-protein kinase CTR1